jgi:hypothetical protein
VLADPADIRSYLDACIQDHDELVDFVQEDPDLYEEIVKTLVQKSGGM